MQTALARIWAWIAAFISYDGNSNTKCLEYMSMWILREKHFQKVFLKYLLSGMKNANA